MKENTYLISEVKLTEQLSRFFLLWKYVIGLKEIIKSLCTAGSSKSAGKTAEHE